MGDQQFDGSGPEYFSLRLVAHDMPMLKNSMAAMERGVDMMGENLSWKQRGRG